MSWSDVTASPDFEDVRRTAALEALARNEFAPGFTRDEDSAGLFRRDPPVIWPLAAEYVSGSVDSSTDDSAASLVNRIIAARQHNEIIEVLPLLELRTIATRLNYLLECSQEDPDEPTMALTSLRELALFFASEPQRDEPEIGLSPDGHLQAEWRVGDGGILAMKFLRDGLIQFAAISRPTGGRQPFRVNGTLPKDRALDAVRAFIRRGPL